jgi:hypothetical protein
MIPSVVEQSSAAPAVTSRQALVVKRIRFVAEPLPGEKVLRRWKQPRPCCAVEETLPLEELPRAKTWPEPADHLVVVFVPRSACTEWKATGGEWLSPPEDPEAPQAVEVPWEGETVSWRPGRAVVEGRCENREALLAALAEFAFCEGELRTLEHGLEPTEASAQADVALAYGIRYRARGQWQRITETIQALYRMRLAYARLAPRLGRPARGLPARARQLVARLGKRADVADRLEAFSERLEACEDLYEGASDRVADFKGYFIGHIFELIIIILLLLEVILVGVDLFMRNVE